MIGAKKSQTWFDGAKSCLFNFLEFWILPNLFTILIITGAFNHLL